MWFNILDKCFPFFAALIAERDLNKEIKKLKPEDITKKWFNKLASSVIDENVIEKIAHDIYQSQERRISNIENKAISLIVAIGFSISLLTIIIGYEPSEFGIFRIISIVFFIVAIFTLIIGAGSAIHAYRIGRRSVATINEFEEMLDKKEKNILDWASKYLSAVEINNRLSLIKSNWVDTAQRHTMFGLILIFLGTLFVITDVFYAPGNHFTINLVENIQIDDSIMLGYE